MSSTDEQTTVLSLQGATQNQRISNYIKEERNDIKGNLLQYFETESVQKSLNKCDPLANDQEKRPFLTPNYS